MWDASFDQVAFSGIALEHVHLFAMRFGFFGNDAPDFDDLDCGVDLRICRDTGAQGKNSSAHSAARLCGSSDTFSGQSSQANQDYEWCGA